MSTGRYENARKVPAEDIVWWHTSVGTQLKGYSSHYGIWTNCVTWQIPEHMLVKVLPLFPSLFSFLPWSKFMYVNYGMLLKLKKFFFSHFGRAVRTVFLSQLICRESLNIMAKKKKKKGTKRRKGGKRSYFDIIQRFQHTSI